MKKSSNNNYSGKNRKQNKKNSDFNFYSKNTNSSRKNNRLTFKYEKNTSFNNFSETTYLDINIVDRGSAIASFIGSATLPGTSTAVNETGKINFTEKDGGSITLDYNQNLAYEAMSSAGYLASSLTTTPSLASYN